MGEKVLHGVTGEVGSEHPVEPVGEGNVEARGHLVAKAEKSLPSPQEVGLVEVALDLDVAGESADGHFLEHASAAGPDKRAPAALQRVGKLNIHHQRDLQKIPLGVGGGGAVEGGVAPRASEGAVAADGVGVDRVVDTAGFELEPDPFVEAVAGGEVETEARVEGNRLIADRAVKVAVAYQRIDVWLGVGAAFAGGDGHVAVDGTAEGEAQVEAGFVGRLGIHIRDLEALGGGIGRWD